MTCSGNTILSHSPVDPWHKFYTAAGIYTFNITICIAYSVLIMLITCLTLCCEKWLYLAVHCLPMQLTVWLKCTFRQPWMARFFHVAGFIQAPEKCIQVNWFRSATKVTIEKWVCSCPNTQSLLASKMINQLVWETKRQRHFFTRPVKLLHIFYVGLCIILFIQPVPFLCIFLLLVVFKLGLHYPFLLHWNCSAVKRL